MIEPILWLGLVAEMKGDWSEALKRYQECRGEYHDAEVEKKDWSLYGCLHFASEALVGQVHALYELGSYTGAAGLALKAEREAKANGYCNQMALIRLIQGHAAWERNVENRKRRPVYYYREALEYALYYSPYLLDEILSGPEDSTPSQQIRRPCPRVQPIIERCLEHGAEGRQVLTELKDWWKEANCRSLKPGPLQIRGRAVADPTGLATFECAERHREQGIDSSQSVVVATIERKRPKE